MEKLCQEIREMDQEKRKELLNFAFRNQLAELFKATLQEDIEIGKDELDEYLTFSSKIGYINGVNFLLKAGANPNANDTVALKYACEQGHTEVAILLLKAGADSNVGDGLPLYIACINQHPYIISVLFEYGASPNLSNAIEGYIEASEFNSTYTIGAFLDNGVSKDATYKALLNAIKAKSKDSAQLLLSAWCKSES